MLNCICIKWGKKYTTEDVNRLFRAVSRETIQQVRFFCMTDDRTGLSPGIEFLPLVEEPHEKRMMAAQERFPRKGALKKIALFRPDLVPDLDGPLLALDLDIVVVGDLHDLAEFSPGFVCMRRPFHILYHHTLGEGSVIKFEPQKHAALYEGMARNPEASVLLGEGSEQSYTSLTAAKNGYFVNFPDRWIASFKRDCVRLPPLNLFRRPLFPAGAKAICFYGKPSIQEAIDGYNFGPVNRSPPCDWIKAYWK